MRSLLFTALSGVALLGFSAPAMAQYYDANDEHHDQHDQLNEEHSDVHHQVNDIHNDAHEQGISGYDEQRLHQQLDRAHARADGNIQAQHYYEHQTDQYGYGGNNGYYGYGGQQGYYGYGGPQGYYGYGGQQGYYGSNGYNGYNRGYAYRRIWARHHRHNRYRG